MIIVTRWCLYDNNVSRIMTIPSVQVFLKSVWPFLRKPCTLDTRTKMNNPHLYVYSTGGKADK